MPVMPRVTEISSSVTTSLDLAIPTVVQSASAGPFLGYMIFSGCRCLLKLARSSALPQLTRPLWHYHCGTFSWQMDQSTFKWLHTICLLTNLLNTSMKREGREADYHSLIIWLVFFWHTKQFHIVQQMSTICIGYIPNSCIAHVRILQLRDTG